MHKTLFVFALVFVAFVVGCQREPAKTGHQVTSFTLHDVDGNPVSMSDYRGKVVLLEFWATWCPPCRLAVSELNGLAERFKDDDFAIIAASMDESVEDVRRFIEEKNINYVVVIDDMDVNHTFGVTSIPTTFIIDKDGKILRKHLGFMPGLADVFAKDIKELLR